MSIVDGLSAGWPGAGPGLQHCHPARRSWAVIGSAALGLLLAGCGLASAATPSAPVSPATPPAEASAATPPASPTPAFARGSVSIRTAAGQVHLVVEVASTEAERQYGLMNRDSLAPDAGMLFVFRPPANAQRVGFWMKDTRIPLSVAFVEPSMIIESIQDMAPLSTQVHYAPRDYAYALEVNKGFFQAHGIATGDRLTVLKTSTAASG